MLSSLPPSSSLSPTLGSLDGTVHLYHAQNNKLLSSYAHSLPQVSEDGEEEEVQGVECVALAPPPLSYLATGGGDSMLKIWDYTSTHPTPRCTVAHEGAVVSVQWTSVREGLRALLVTAALDKTIRVIDGRTGGVLRALTGHTDLIIQMKMSTLKIGEEEREMVVTVSDDHTARVYIIDLLRV
ncbi:hypothetical protein EON63_23040 [archaeon]|nr:MAG: hypothetical protein EON63_23040 [archaeon]